MSTLRLYTLLSASIFLAACDTDDITNDINHSETLDTMVVSGVGGTTTVDSENRTNLTVSGINGTFNIQSDLHNLVVSGSNNTFNFSAGVDVEHCTVTGSDNSASFAGNNSLDCSVTGSGNTGF